MTPERQNTANQSEAIENVFSQAGFETISPPVIQAADPFLDLSGEDIRSRIYVFSDPWGKELCLRPDLTIPACLHYLNEAAGAHPKRHYAYEGLAFRCQSPGSSRPNEFSQSGIEIIGEENSAAVDARVFALTLEACRKAGLAEVSITTGDLGLFAAFIEGLDIPQHWRARLRRNFCQPSRFGALLKVLTGNWQTPDGLTAIFGRLDEGSALETVSGLLDLAGLDAVPGRSMQSVSRRLTEKARDAAAEPLSPGIIASIEDYLKISGSPREALKRVRALAGREGLAIEGALEMASARFGLMEEACGKTEMTFATEFGRSFDYYTGFVFELNAAGVQIAGGGRYDDLLMRLGADKRVPAVGAMIRNDRLRAAVGNSEGTV